MATLTPLVVSLFLLLTVIPAYAAVFSIASGNAMALIAAINAANANNDANAINLAAGTYSLTVIDNDSPNGRNGPSGDYEHHDSKWTERGSDHNSSLRRLSRAGSRGEWKTQFRTQDSGIQCGDNSVAITGQAVNGRPIQGSDSCYYGWL